MVKKLRHYTPTLTRKQVRELLKIWRKMDKQRRNK